MDDDDYMTRSVIEMLQAKQYFLAGELFPSRPSPKATAEADYIKAKKEVAEFIHPISTSLDWSDVIGNEEAKAKLLEAIEAPILYADLYSFYGMDEPKGCLLWGPPGCGKTMLAKAAASALARLHGNDAEMLLVNGAELQSPWVGVTEAKIRAFFSFARAYRTFRNHPLVIFIDEADAILPSRSDSSARFEISNVSTFLAEMDGLKENDAYVILATNRPESIDEALLRDGRISHKVKIERPGLETIKSILGKELRNVPKAAGFSVDLWSDRIADYLVAPERKLSEITLSNGKETHSIPLTLAHIISGAMVVGLVARAKSIAFSRDLSNGTRTGVDETDLLRAIDQLVTENSGLPHDFAANELITTFVERLNRESRESMKRMMN